MVLSSQTVIIQCTLQFHPVDPSIRTLPFTIPYIYILKIFMYGTRDFNRTVTKNRSGLRQNWSKKIQPNLGLGKFRSPSENVNSKVAS